MLTANNILEGLNKLNENQKNKLPVIIGDSPKSNVVVAYVLVTKPSPYRDSHIRISEDLDALVSELRYTYDMTENDILNSVMPLAGFSVIDLAEYFSK